MSKMTGKAYIDLPGIGRLKTRQNGATLNLGGFNREMEVGDSGINGYRETHVAPTMQLQLSHDSALDLVALNNLVGIAVPFETDTGQVYVMQESVTSEPVTVNSQGEVTLNLTGVRVDRVA